MTDGAARRGLLEGGHQLLGLVAQRDTDHHRHGEPERLAADPGLIAFDHALGFQRLDAAGDGRRRKRDALGQLDLAQAAIFSERREDGAIERI